MFDAVGLGGPMAGLEKSPVECMGVVDGGAMGDGTGPLSVVGRAGGAGGSSSVLSIGRLISVGARW